MNDVSKMEGGILLYARFDNWSIKKYWGVWHSLAMSSKPGEQCALSAGSNWWYICLNRILLQICAHFCGHCGSTRHLIRTVLDCNGKMIQRKNILADLNSLSCFTSLRPPSPIITYALVVSVVETVLVDHLLSSTMATTLASPGWILCFTQHQYSFPNLDTSTRWIGRKSIQHQDRYFSLRGAILLQSPWKRVRYASIHSHVLSFLFIKFWPNSTAYFTLSLSSCWS